MTWTWQDEAWRLYSSMGALTYSTASVVQLRIGLYNGQTPPEEDDGGSGVREPRRPTPHAPAGSQALELVSS